MQAIEKFFIEHQHNGTYYSCGIKAKSVLN